MCARACIHVVFCALFFFFFWHGCARGVYKNQTGNSSRVNAPATRAMRAESETTSTFSDTCCSVNMFGCHHRAFRALFLA